MEDVLPDIKDFPVWKSFDDSCVGKKVSVSGYPAMINNKGNMNNSMYYCYTRGSMPKDYEPDSDYDDENESSADEEQEGDVCTIAIM